ncbi:protocadherin Fat 4-like [Oopsacas minuta]|uniref:Protocadherin Fat 4-like n=1 Tax=Oopsacas minuta TaxID=111878 RepID=A0AAV7JJ36_9METZ|nr:protocadherin Fat 4-like [Oopsacas minuta]
MSQNQLLYFLTRTLFSVILVSFLTSWCSAQNLAPVFSKDIYIVPVREDHLVSTHAYTVEATDSDSFTYSLDIIGGVYFSIDPTLGVITLIQSLDRETFNTIQFNVIADDSLLQGFAVILVIIGDYNDNAPQFTNFPYEGDIDESTAVEGFVLQVSALDDDAGQNSQILFSLDSVGNTGGAFQIDSVVGNLRVATALDYETLNHYSLTVIATDLGSPALSTSIGVFVSIGNVQDELPRFVNTPYSGVAVEGAASVGTAVLQVFADDGDTTDLDKVQFDITSGDAGGNFGIGSDGTITIQTALDREQDVSYSLQIRAAEISDATSSSFAAVAITVLDINDNSPVFDQPYYAVEVSEGAPINLVVYTGVSASDTDDGTNALFSFSLRTVSPVFSIDAMTGNLIVTGLLDRETTSSYSLMLLAIETLTAENSVTEVPLTVTITDENDVSPYFNTQIHYLSILENQPIGTPVSSITASDDDLGLAGMVSYSLSGTDSSLFSVNGDGDISTSMMLDRESVSVYTITLLATDLDPLNPRTTAAQLIISVNDTNDNNPFFDPSTYSQSVSEAAVPSSLVIQVTASDNDEGINAEVEYRLDPLTNPGSSFLIDSTSGVISVLSQLDADSPATSFFSLRVVATDKGQGGRTGTCLVLITVLDANDKDPVFSLSTYTATVSEDAQDGSSVVQVLAIDNDTSHNALIKYAIYDPPQGLPFRIDITTGLITVAGVLDRETGAFFSFSVIAFDSAIDPHNGTADVEVVLTDVNDNAPVFSQDIYPISVVEDSHVGLFVMKLEGSDSDEGINQEFNFTILSGNIADTFSLIPSDGTLSISNPPQWSLSQNSFSILVEIRDKGSPSLSSTALINVNITDTNNQNPQFIGAPYSFVVTEGSGPEATLGRVYASDGDNPNLVFGQVRYSIISGNTGSAFSLSSETGEISVSSLSDSPDRETTNNYTLKIEASDLDTSPRTSDLVDVFITVLDINDNSPIFSETTYTAELIESAHMGTYVITVLATDMDEGENQKIQYSIVGGDTGDMFSIDTDTGLVSATAISTDRETAATHQLTIRAQDNGPTPRVGTADLIITLLDVNDNSPTFEQSIYRFSVLENVTINTQLDGVVTALDPDSIENGTVSYSIAPGLTVPFDFIIGTNILITTGLLDRETTSLHTFMVRASDMGSPTRHTDVVISVIIKDVNDNDPQFLNSELSIKVPEDVFLGAQLFLVNITDIDIELNKKVVFFISGGEGMFAIGLESGSLFTISELDREDTDSYELVITARDGGDPSLTSEYNLLVNITDINDNPPTFPASYDILVSEYHVLSSAITTLSAPDRDIGINAIVSYTLYNASRVDAFSLSSSGVLTLTDPLDFEITQSYLFIAIATDAGTPVLSSTVSVNITVVDENDNTPVFGELFYRAGVLENSPHGTSVIVLTATDRDSGRLGTVGFQINEPTANQQHFEIDPTTGQVATHDIFDNRVGTIYVTDVTAYDNGMNSPYNSATVYLTITIITGSYLVITVIQCEPLEVVSNINQLIASYEKITNSMITVYDVTPHVDNSVIDLSKTDVYVFAVNSEGLLIPQANLVKLLDENIELLRTLSDCDIEAVLEETPATPAPNYDLLYWSLIGVLAVFVCIGMTCCCLLFCQARRHRRRQYTGSKDSRFESVMNSLADLSNLSSRFFSSSAALDNPLYRPPYDDWSSAQSGQTLHYESQELIMEMFSESMDNMSHGMLLPHGSENSNELFSPFDRYDSEELEIDFRELYNDDPSVTGYIDGIEGEMATEDDLKFIDSEEGSISII